MNYIRIKQILSIVLFFFFSLPILAQNSKDKEGNARELIVYMQVKDHLTHDGIDSTLTAKLLNASDSSYIDSVHVDCMKWDGKCYTSASAKITQPGEYLVRLEADEYETKYVSLNIPKLYKRERYMEFKTQYLHKQKKKLDVELDELVVRATKLKFYMDGDTLVYNADAFNLAEGSMIDALIRKLPGVEVKKGGEIYVNGQKVEALLLNGKDFFDSDRELMLENMPAYMVKNIQSYERVPENVKGTNKEKTAKKELVMNVKLKREYNKGWLSNVEGGIGTPMYGGSDDARRDTKFMGRLFALRFSDKSRLMFFANANNLNDDRTPGNEGEWSPLTQSQGLAETYKAGAEYSVGSWEHMRYHASANASYQEKDDASNTKSTTFLEGGDTYGRSFSQQKSYNVNAETTHEIFYRTNQAGKWYKSILLYVRPSLSFMKWNNHALSASTSLAADVAEQLGKAWMDSITAPNAGELLKKYAITRTINRSKGDGHYTSVSNYGYMSYSPTHNDMLSFLMNFHYSYSDRTQNDYEHFRLDNPRNPLAVTDFRNRYTPYYNITSSFNINPELSVNLNNDEKKMHSMSVEYTYNFNYNNTNNSIYLLNKLQEWGEGTQHSLGTLPSMEEMQKAMDADNSSHSRSTVHSHTPHLTYRYTTRGDNSMGAIYASLTMPIRHETLDYWQGSQVDTLFTRTTSFLAPSVGYWYDDWNKSRRINVSYSLDSNAPTMTSLLNITNTNNPLYITRSNPHLRNTHIHSFDASYRDKFGRGTLFNAYTRATITQNAVASGTVFDRTTGVTTATPDNVNGNWTIDSNIGVDVPLTKSEKWRIRNDVSYAYNHSVDLNGETTTNGGASTRSVVGTSTFSNELRGNYRPNDKMEFSVSGDVDYQHSTSDREHFTPINACDFNYGFRAQVELPWQIQLSTDLTMYSRRGYSDSSMNTDELVWNARVTKRLAKGNLLIHLDTFDLLGNLSNVRRTVNAQGRTETFYNVIPSYCLLHIAWKINKRPKKA